MDFKAPNGSGSDANPLYRFRSGAVEYDEARFELRLNGLLINDVERKPLQVLAELLRHANHVVTRKQLVDSVWNGRLTVDHALGNAISKLRKAFDDPDGERIVTVARQGYKWSGGPVERVIVGRRIVSRLALKTGDLVPGRSDCELVSPLGSSQGNEVWVAQDLTQRTRRVFKFNRLGEALGSLKREARVHRLLQATLGPRPDRVQLLGWNFETPPFYLEWEFGGDNLDTWAGTDRHLESLDLNARLALFLQLADAIVAAHSVGVLHKDVKPANVLVAPGADGTWHIRVVDWGSAEVLEPERLEELGITRLGATLNEPLGGAGTLLYMAPELIAGGIPTTMSDIYSLGILLFQLSVGDMRRPLTSDWTRYVRDALLREDIGLATAADPQNRLPSVAELARRLRTRDARSAAAIAAETAAARGAAAAETLERARARRPWLVAALASLVAGIVVSLTLYHREYTARREAVRENLRTQAVNGFLDEILHGVDPTEPRGSAKTPLQEVLRRAADKLQAEFAEDPETKATVALTLANSFFGLSQFATALPLDQQAVALRTAALGPRHPATLEAEYELARTLDMVSRHAEASRVLDAADGLAEPLFASNPKLALKAHSTRGGNEFLQMHTAAALAHYERADALRQRVSPGDDELLVNLRSNIAWCDVRLERNDEAIQALAPLLLPHYSPDVIGIAEWIKVRLQYALALKNRSDFAAAARLLDETRGRAVEVLGPSHYLVGLTWNYSSDVYLAQGLWKPALAAAQHAFDLWRSTVALENQATHAARADIAVIGYLAEQTPSTLGALEEAHADLEKFAGAESPLTQYVTFYWANALLDAGRAAEAATLGASLSASALAALDPALGWDARLKGLRGRIDLAEQRTDAARASLQSAIATLSRQGAQPWVLDPLKAELRRAESETLASKAM